MRIKTIATGMSAALLAAMLATPAIAQDKPVFGVLLKTLSNPFWGAMEQGIEDGTKEANVEYFLQAVESDQAAEPQLNTCNTMLQRKPAVMITAAINSTILLPCLKQATEMGIPVVDLDANLDHDIAEKAGVKIAFTIGSDNTEAGAKGADFMAEHLKGKKGSVLVIEGLAGNITGQKRAKGFADRLAKVAPDLKIVASLPGDWDRQKAANITNDTLTANPDLVGIFCANDTMALGAVESVYAAGKGGEIAVIGVDGNTDAVKSIKAGRLTASVAQLPYLVGKQAVEKAKTLLEGGEVKKFTYVDTLVLTKEVMEAGTDPNLQYVK
ncbi:sugar ABC transporter substrate-binding protein [Dongia deserti]|uniref:sugar ABC transporter substrate-binding protein n=1 Tax=Dongia deserti TaxID=2268030 RepID=UPI000E65E062|nr:substrate-binding domain-containing protein [Dongia deserti]